MDQKERRALDRCFDDFLKDLDPSPAFLHSLYAEKVLTEEHIDKINKHASRETKVTLLLRYLPQRGPDAFSIFKSKLDRTYPWLSEKLEKELEKLQRGQSSINKKLLSVINTQLHPLVYNSESSYGKGNSDLLHPVLIIQKLSELLSLLERQCLKVLSIKHHELEDDPQPLSKLIERRLNLEKSRVIEENLEDLSKEVKDLKKQVKDTVKLKAENERLKNLVLRQKDKLKDYTKIQREAKKHKTEMDKIVKENELLKFEIQSIREQLRSNISTMFG